MSPLIYGLLFGGVLGFVWSGYCTRKGYSKLIEFIGDGIMIIVMGYFFLFRTPSFTGSPYQDAKIMYERIYEDGENVDKVMNELYEYYIDKGYGMPKAKEALMILSDM